LDHVQGRKTRSGPGVRQRIENADAKQTRPALALILATEHKIANPGLGQGLGQGMTVPGPAP
jgi:hypothetical protein